MTPDEIKHLRTSLALSQTQFDKLTGLRCNRLESGERTLTGVHLRVLQLLMEREHLRAEVARLQALLATPELMR